MLKSKNGILIESSVRTETSRTAKVLKPESKNVTKSVRSGTD
jgi:hypothetical protein